MLLLWLFSFCVAVSGFMNPYPKGKASRTTGGNAGDPLFLTPYIKAGKIKEAREKALVPPLVGEVKSYSGFFTVDEKCGSNMFAWFFPCQGNAPNAPVVLWLQGGPGATSLYGLFDEHGPYELTPDNNLTVRKYSWNQGAHVIYIDNPVGAGYSFTGSDECYSKNEVEVGKNLLEAMKQFFQLFPEYKNNPFFATGESYAGKYVPALSYAIYKDNDTARKINLTGLAIGNGLVDPVNQLHYSDYLYQLSLIDANARQEFYKMEDNCRNLIRGSKWEEAFHCFDEILNGDQLKWPTFFQNVTGFTWYFNFLHAKPEVEGDVDSFVTKDQIRKSIHVGDLKWNGDSPKVENFLLKDVMQSVRPWLEELVERFRVLIYNGQMDIIVAYPLTEAYLQKLNWSAAGEYKKAVRSIWKVDGEVAGYSKKAGKLTEVLVRNAGHMAPRDQPKWAYDLISRFLYDKPFH